MSLTRLQAIAAALGVLWGADALAADIYRCQIDGVTTFVDSQSRCPLGDARRVGRDVPKASAVMAPASASAPLAATSRCQDVAHDPTRFRECLRKERRADVRRIATARLEAIQRAVRDYIAIAARGDSIIAVANKGRGAAWCETILGDVMAQENIEVVDDEAIGAPRWMRSGNAPGRSAAEILDPNFEEWRIAGGKVPDGYVTARWRGATLVVLRMTAACTSGDDGVAHCNPQPYTSFYVYDDVTPIACDVSAVGRAYWPAWKSSMTPIFETGTRRTRR